MIASMTRSQSLKSSKLVVPQVAEGAVRSSAVTLPLATPSVRNFSIRASPLSRYFCSTSRTMVV
jgi:hypothetical protein